MWEYKRVWFPGINVIDASTDFEQRMDRLGKEGWELVSFFQAHWKALNSGVIDQGGYIALFKRPKQDEQ